MFSRRFLPISVLKNWIYLTISSLQSLASFSGKVILTGNPIICMTELCWLFSKRWAFTLAMTCPGDTSLANISQEVICQGKWEYRHSRNRTLLYKNDLAGVVTCTWKLNARRTNSRVGKTIFVSILHLFLHEKQHHGPLTRYIKLQVVHAPGTFSPPSTSTETAT